MKIVIHANGGTIIGMGHIMRTLVLAKELSLNNDVFFICKTDKDNTDKYRAGIEKVKQQGFKLVEVCEQNFMEKIKNINADCIITDSYDVNEEYFDIVKKYFKYSGYIDDINICKYFNVDFLINLNIYAKKLTYKTNYDTKLLLGSNYVLLRDEFRNSHNLNKNINSEIKKILITVGGSDNNNVTEEIIKKLKCLNCELHIIVGSGFIYIDNLKACKNEKTKLHFNANMVQLMCECDVAVSSCGSTLYELASCGIPTLGIIAAENQKLAAETMDSLGIIRYTEIDDIYSSILELSYNERCLMSKKAYKIVDGNGAIRLAEYINSLEKYYNRE
ncbi:UDP-2,4-diacetamido-2,4,6-trideoxy-beta-L-altropyranose hydrolase [Clostridium sp. FP2]|uniref:UDP-2,4-diacetamido-2,4, 6-trideoxy-beta-L-altropyranose hydrolase n=1 Tax=Clostridium sp. FP2 TaxID=2724481 RepID=UPI0013E91A13|nr:UDP-2,4-diacetamido-2,4,6-trideoxy-beta-L-altropyranose hydrolase [Clostridium sp. FP2]MBZ9624556.1 UDP-2,4-diacetamido-2,4,6-trideoxy-beta-L-altropyranose hydrolase [Clostridium sp. FP2]